MALDIAINVGKGALKVGLEGILCFGAVSNGLRCITDLKKLKNTEEGVTGQRVQDLFLTCVRCIAYTAGALKWAEYCEWISLGAASPVIGFISYPCLLITSLFEAVAKARKIAELRLKPDVLHRDWRIGVEGLRLSAQVCLVALSIIGAAALITANPALSVAALITVIAYGVLSGFAYSLEKEVNKWGPRAFERCVGT